MKDSTKSYWMSLIAMVVSIAALVVSVYEARIMNAQKETSVWPYLKVNSGIKTDSEKVLISMKLTNKGVGPAIVRKTQLNLKSFNLEMSEYDETIQTLVETLPEEMMQGLTLNADFSGVLSPGEEVVLYELELSSSVMDYWKYVPEYNLCYCSIYDECWNLSGKEPNQVEGKCKT